MSYITVCPPLISLLSAHYCLTPLAGVSVCAVPYSFDLGKDRFVWQKKEKVDMSEGVCTDRLFHDRSVFVMHFLPCL